MPFLAPLGAAGISALIGGGASIAGGALSSRQKTQTSTTTPNALSPEFKALQDRLMAYSNGLMSDPAAGTQPIKLSAMEGINRKYAGMPDAISRKMASRGYGSSGNFGNTMYQSELSRMGDMSNLEGMMAEMILGRQQQGAGLANDMIKGERGFTQTGTMPGDMLGSAFQSAGNGLSNLSTLMMLSKVLKGGGGVWDENPNQTTLNLPWLK